MARRPFLSRSDGLQPLRHRPGRGESSSAQRGPTCWDSRAAGLVVVAGACLGVGTGYSTAVTLTRASASGQGRPVMEMLHDTLQARGQRPFALQARAFDHAARQLLRTGKGEVLPFPQRQGLNRHR